MGEAGEGRPQAARGFARLPQVLVEDILGVLRNLDADEPVPARDARPRLVSRRPSGVAAAAGPAGRCCWAGWAGPGWLPPLPPAGACWEGGARLPVARRSSHCTVWQNVPLPRYWITTYLRRATQPRVRRQTALAPPLGGAAPAGDNLLLLDAEVRLRLEAGGEAVVVHLTAAIAAHVATRQDWRRCFGRLLGPVLWRGAGMAREGAGGRAGRGEAPQGRRGAPSHRRRAACHTSRPHLDSRVSAMRWRHHGKVVQLARLALALVPLAVEDRVRLGEQHVRHLLRRERLHVVQLPRPRRRACEGDRARESESV